MKRWVFAILVVCIAAPLLRAQNASADSSTAGSHVQQNLWLSGGIGSGGAAHTGGGIAGVATGWYAYGPYVLGARASEGGPWLGPDTREKAALVGLRARSKHAFALVGVGAGTMSGSRSNGEQSGTRTVFGDQPSVAYGAEAAITYYVIGIGLDVFGASGHRTSYSGVALSIQLGYLK